MTQLEHIKTIFKAFSDADNSILIPYETEVPAVISDVYRSVCKEINFVYDLFKEVSLNLGADIKAFESFEQKNHNLNSSVIIAGGAISDLIISQELNRPYSPKDIDVFVQKCIADFFCEIIHSLRSNSNHWEYNFLCELYHAGLDVLAEAEKNKNIPIGYLILSSGIKKALDESESEWSGEHFYDTSYVHYLERGTFKGNPVEVILCDDNKVFNFDIIFRSCFFTLDSIYCLDIALEDIRNQVIHIANSQSSMTTLTRALHFKEKFGFELDSLTFNALLESIHSEKIPFEYFFNKAWCHPKATPYVKNHFIQLFNLPLSCDTKEKPDSQSNDSVLVLENFKNVSHNCFTITNHLQSTPMFFKKTKALLENLVNYKPVTCILTRPQNWADEIFAIELSDVGFRDWYRAAVLYDNILPISDTKDDLFNLVSSKLSSKNAYNSFTETTSYSKLFGKLSIFVKSDTFHFPINAKNVIELLHFSFTNVCELSLTINELGKFNFDNSNSPTTICPTRWLASLNSLFSEVPTYYSPNFSFEYKKALHQV